MKLIIVESPTKAKTLSKFLGKDYSAEATVGHIKDLPKSPISVDVENNFAPDYQTVPGQEKVIKAIQKLGKKAEGIYIATDPDREGEAIAAHVAEIVSGNDNIQRIEFHEITKSAVEHAIENPREINDCLVDAQVARRVLDRLVGYTLSPVLWKKVRRGLSAGRVQSVAVRLIVEKEDERNAFKAEEFWIITSELNKAEPFSVELTKIDGKKAEVSNEKQAKEIVSGLEKSEYVVDKIIKKEAKAKPLPPFTTSTLTQAAANLFGYSAKRTMRAAQALYEEGLITYHRTDSVTIAKTAVAMAEKYIKGEFGNEYYPDTPRAYKTKSKSAQEAHEAIRPTSLKSKVEIEKKLYDLIWNRFLASQMASSIADRTTINVAAGKYLLRVTGSVMKFDGFKKVWNYSSKNGDTLLPELKEGEKVDLIKVNSEQKFTQPPARYNEASLIKKLEELGIGRPSTYAPTIYTIQVRKYVEKEESRFVPTPVGEATNAFLVKNFADVVDYGFTAQMEDDLDKVAEGEIKWQDRIGKFWGPFSKTVDDVTENAERIKIPVEELDRECPECKKAKLVIRVGRFGKFISCGSFPDCKFTEKYLDKIGMKCPECKDGDVIAKKTRKGRTFYGCSTYPECDYASWTDPRKSDEKDDKADK